MNIPMPRAKIGDVVVVNKVNGVYFNEPKGLFKRDGGTMETYERNAVVQVLVKHVHYVQNSTEFEDGWHYLIEDSGGERVFNDSILMNLTTGTDYQEKEKMTITEISGIPIHGYKNCEWSNCPFNCAPNGKVKATLTINNETDE